MIRNLFLPLLAVATFSYMVWHVTSTSTATPQTEPVLQPARSPFNGGVAGVGLIEPRSENIQVAAVVPGTVVEVAAVVGETVSPGDVLFRLDDRQRKSDLAVQESQLAEAQSTLARWEQMPRAEDVPVSEARIKKLQADVTLRQDQLQRTRGLAAQKILTEQELIEREQALRAAQAELTQAQAEDARLKAGAWKADLAVARTQVERSRQLVEQARVELDRLVVRSPIRGTVLKVDVRPGEYVGTPPGKPLIILGDLEQLHVRVDIDEQDLPRFRPGMSGLGFVRGDAERPLALKFARIEPFAEPKRSLTGAGQERVDTRVLQVIYAIESSPRTVYVGQQIDVFLDKPTEVARAR
jgi:multidrug efflux pump subunit AcrA (membrane-fusion protein)